MPDEEFEASVSVEWVETDEQPFRPEKTTEIFAVLEPIEKEQATFFSQDYLDFYPNVLPPFIPDYEALPEFQAAQKEIIINIETTAAKPWESRLICIGVMDPNALEPQAMNFIEETELETLDSFLDWFKTVDYSTLIGYNVSFDYRFLYVLMQKYRKNVPRWKDMDLYDLMQQQKQVKHEFVFGFNPPGKLEEWATYLLGTKPYAPQKQINIWYREQNIDEIVNFNSDKIVKSYFLWVLDKVVAGTIPGQEVLGRPTTPTAETQTGTMTSHQTTPGEQIKVSCPNCMQEQVMQKTDKVIQCNVCSTPVSNPNL